jgi:hypothetical protein
MELEDSETVKLTKKKANEQKLRPVLEAFKILFLRGRKYQDPVMRSTILVDKLASMIEMLCAFLTTSEEYTDEFNQEIMGIKRNIDTELDLLLEWIRSPHYSPDHVFGQAVTKDLYESK